MVILVMVMVMVMVVSVHLFSSEERKEKMSTENKKLVMSDAHSAKPVVSLKK